MKHLSVCIVLLGFFVFAQEAKASGTIVTNNLESYWHYKQGVSGGVWKNIAPATPNQHDGVINGASLQSDGLYFDGGDWVTATGFPLSFDKFTMEVTNTQVLMGYYHHSRIWNFNNGGRGISADFSIQVSDSADSMYSMQMLNPGQFYTVTVAWDGSINRGKLYINGSLAKEQNIGKEGWNSPDGKLYIGSHYGGGNMVGTIKSVKVYNRILSDAEIAQNYQVPMDEVGIPAVRAWNITSPSTAVDFGVITVNDQIQVRKANVGTIPIQHTGSNTDGWKLSVSASPFTQIGGIGLTLPTGHFKLKGIQGITRTSGSSPLPVISGADWVLDNGPVEIIRAAAGTGEGDFNVTFEPDALELAVDTGNIVVDENQNPTRYQSVITWQMSVGP